MRSAGWGLLLVLCSAPLTLGQGWGLSGTVDTYAAVQIPAPNAGLAGRLRGTLSVRRDTPWGRLYLAHRLTHHFVNRAGAPLLQNEIREGYVDWYTDRVDLRIGLQQIVWGEADGAFITDLWSPLDLTEFLTQEFSALRRGIPAVQATGYFGAWTLTGVWMPIHRSTRLPRPSSRWNVIPPVVEGVAVRIRPQDTPEVALKNGEVALRVSYEGVPLTTLRVMYGYGWNRLPALFKQPVLAPGSLQLDLTPTYSRRHVVGVSFSSAWVEPLVLSGELSMQHRVRFDVAVPSGPITAPDPSDPTRLEDLANGFLLGKPYTQFMLGAERRWGNQVLRVQGLGRLIHDHQTRILQDAWVPAVTALWIGLFRRETLQIQFFTYLNPGRDYWMHPALTYTLRDGLNATLGLQWFGTIGQNPAPTTLSFAPFDTFDLLYMRLRYSF